MTVSGCSCISREETGVALLLLCHVSAHTEEVSLVLLLKSISSESRILNHFQFVCDSSCYSVASSLSSRKDCDVRVVTIMSY